MLGMKNQINPVPEGFREVQAAAKLARDEAEVEAVKERAKAKAAALAAARAEALAMVDDAPTEEGGEGAE